MTDLQLNTAGGRYRLKPIPCEAIFYDGGNTEAVVAWAKARGAVNTASLPDESNPGMDMIALRSPMDEWIAFNRQWIVFEPEFGFDTLAPGEFAQMLEPDGEVA